MRSLMELDLSEFEIGNIPPPEERVDLADYPADTIDFLRPFCELWHIPPPRRVRKNGSHAAWIAEAREGRDACKPFASRYVLERVYVEWNRLLHQGKGYMIGRPGAVITACRAKVGELIGMAVAEPQYDETVADNRVECPRCHLLVNPATVDLRCDGAHHVRGRLEEALAAQRREDAERTA